MTSQFPPAWFLLTNTTTYGRQAPRPSTDRVPLTSCQAIVTSPVIVTVAEHVTDPGRPPLPVIVIVAHMEAVITKIRVTLAVMIPTFIVGKARQVQATRRIETNIIDFGDWEWVCSYRPQIPCHLRQDPKKCPTSISTNINIIIIIHLREATVRCFNTSPPFDRHTATAYGA